MQRVSAAYKAEQNDYLRQENYIWVYLGVVSKEAQQYGKANGTFTPYSQEDKVTKDTVFEAYYATPEEDMARVDATQFFMPRSGAFALYQGAVTQELCAPIRFTFEPYTSLDIKGLTIDFGDYYPTSFTVTNGQARYTYNYTNDAAGRWVTEDIFRETSYIEIIPHTMKGGRQRLRILSILFGVGLLFDNTSLIATSWKSSCAHISDVLPLKTFQFTISNLDKRFAADDPHSFVAFLQEQQEIEFDFGRKLQDGSLYKIPGGKMYLKSWSSDDMQAKFSAVGFLDYLSATYNKGRYYPNGITLYDLAVDICEDAGIQKYCIDNYLKSLTTHNPVPIEKHKNLLQLIANASRSIMRETRDGGLEILSSFVPNIEYVSANSQTIYYKASNVVDEKISANDYATAEKNYTYADSHQYFIPRTSRRYVDTGFISGAVANASGLFSTNPTLTVQWEAAFTFFNLTILFGDVKPKAIKIYLFHYGTLMETVSWNEIDFSTIVKYDFYDIDKIVIEFMETNPYQRIHIKKVRFGNITDYTLDYKDMASSPLATTTDFIRKVNVVYSEFAPGVTQKKLSTTKAVAGTNTLKFSKPCHDYSLSYKDGGSGILTITSSGAYQLVFTSSRTAEVNINGIEYVVNQKTVTSEVKQVGTDKTATNVLIDNAAMAEAECEWLCEYYGNDIEYQINYRGEPALDPDDQIFTENKYVEKNLIRITDTQIDTSTGMSMQCKLNARRTHYIEPALVDVAIVDESEVSS